MQSGIFSRLIGRSAEIKALPVTLRYPPSLLRWEFAKGLAGALGGAAIVVGLEPAPLLGWPLGVIAALFALYAGQQVRRGRLLYEVSEHGAAQVRGLQRVEIPWVRLEKLRLNFYGYGKRASQGTLVLLLESGGRRIKLDSGADHFPTLLFHAAQVARQRDLPLEPTTSSNLEQLGL